MRQQEQSKAHLHNRRASLCSFVSVPRNCIVLIYWWKQRGKAFFFLSNYFSCGCVFETCNEFAAKHTLSNDCRTPRLCRMHPAARPPESPALMATSVPLQGFEELWGGPGEGSSAFHPPPKARARAPCSLLKSGSMLSSQSQSVGPSEPHPLNSD